LAGASLACFLLPLLLALGGAVCFHHSPATQLSGAVGGLAIGMFSWAVVARLFRQVPEEAA
jgi:hypothetical protein